MLIQNAKLHFYFELTKFVVNIFIGWQSDQRKKTSKTTPPPSQSP